MVQGYFIECETLQSHMISCRSLLFIVTTMNYIHTSLYRYVFVVGQQYSSEELKDMVSDKIENAIQDKGNEMAAKINVLLVTADIDEYYATLSYIKSPIIQHKHYIIGLFGFSYVALQRITDFQETIELVSKGKKVFCNLSAVFSLGVIYGVENKKIERLSVLISKTLSLYKPPNSITHWKNIMYLPSPINNHFESLLSDWHPDFKIANRLLEKPHCFFGNVLYGNEVTRDIIDKYPDADGIEIDDRGLFYKDVLDYNLNLMIIKAVCGSVNQEERDYYSTAAILAADCLHHILADQRMQKIFEKWLYNGKIIITSFHMLYTYIVSLHVHDNSYTLTVI